MWPPPDTASRRYEPRRPEGSCPAARRIRRPDAGERISVAQIALEHAADVAQQPVAGGVPATVVDDLESVEVEIQHRVLAPEVRGACERAGEPLLEFAAIDETRQAVVSRLSRQLDSPVPLARDIVQHEHGADDAARAIANGRGGNVDRELAAVPTRENRVAAAFHRMVLAKQLGSGIDDRFTIGLFREPDRVLERLALRLLGRQARQ